MLVFIVAFATGNETTHNVTVVFVACDKTKERYPWNRLLLCSSQLCLSGIYILYPLRWLDMIWEFRLEGSVKLDMVWKFHIIWFWKIGFLVLLSTLREREGEQSVCSEWRQAVVWNNTKERHLWNRLLFCYTLLW